MKVSHASRDLRIRGLVSGPEGFVFGFDTMLDVLESCSTKRFRDFLQKVRMVDFGDFLSFSMSFGKMIFVCFSPFFFFFLWDFR